MKNFFLVFFLFSQKIRELPVQFYKEEVFIQLDSNEVFVKGKYYFRNRLGKKIRIRLFYPFPVDSEHLYPYSIELEKENFIKTKNGIIFDLILNSLEQKGIVIEYRQKILTNTAKYILTTTKYWWEPIKKAKFVISVSKDYEINISYKPDSMVIKNDRIFLFINKKDFFPDKDIEIKIFKKNK